MSPSHQKPAPKRDGNWIDRWEIIAFAALAAGLVGYLGAIYVLWPKKIDVSHHLPSLPEDPPRPTEPFQWGSIKQPTVAPPIRQSSDVVTPSQDATPQRENSPAKQQLISPRANEPTTNEEAPVFAFYAGPEPKRVRRETIRALKSGETQLWKAGSERGYVLVSTPLRIGEQECRQVSYTLFNQDSQSLSPPTEWCREGRAKWSARKRLE